MCRPHRWLSGLVPLFLLFLAAAGLKVSEVRHDLTQRTAAAVAPFGLSPGAVSVSGRDVSLEGMSFSETDRKKAAAAAADVNGVRLVANQVMLPAEAKPFSLTAVRDGDSLTLTGFVPDATIRAKVAEAAKAIAPKVTDKLAYARGAAPGFSGWAVAALAPLADLKKGEAKLVDSSLTVTGEAGDSTAYQAAVAATQKLPAGMTLAKADIKAPIVSPYVWSAAADAKSATLEGFAPNSQMRAAIVAAAKAALPGRTVVDHMAVARGSAEGFPVWAHAALGALGKLAHGKASLSDSALTISGAAVDSSAYAAVEAALKALPPGLKLAKAEIAAPTVSPYIWSAVVKQESVTLDGFTPSEQARAGVLAATKYAFPGRKILDHMQIARGAAQGYAAWTQAGLAAAGKLAFGKVALSDSALTISGEAPDEASYNAAIAATKALPAGLALAKADILPPVVGPFTWSAEFDGKTLTLKGFAPSEDARAAIVAAAKAAAPDAEIVDRLQIARGAPRGFLDAAKRALAALGGLSAGKAGLTDMQLALAGVAKGGESIESLTKTLKAVFPQVSRRRRRSPIPNGAISGSTRARIQTGRS